jgi:hypothetical protein
MSEHTPTPWIVDATKFGPKIYETGRDADAICQLFDKNGIAFISDVANAAFIVRACNSHDALVKALEEIAGESGKKYPSSIPISVAKRALASLKEPTA